MLFSSKKGTKVSVYLPTELLKYFVQAYKDKALDWILHYFDVALDKMICQILNEFVRKSKQFVKVKGISIPMYILMFKFIFF